MWPTCCSPDCRDWKSDTAPCLRDGIAVGAGDSGAAELGNEGLVCPQSIVRRGRHCGHRRGTLRPRATQFMEFLRSIAQLATEGNTVRLSHAFIQPMAAEDVATAVVEAALAPPANGTIEVGGPEKFHLDELVARVLEYDKDLRKVVTDPDARYSGAKLSENSLIPGKDAKLGSTKFDWWLENVAPPPKK